MASIYVDVPHEFTEQEALRRVQRSLGELKTKFPIQLSDVREEWLGSTGLVRANLEGIPFYGRMSVEASVKVSGRSVEVSSGNLPAFPGAFRGQIEQTIRQHLTELLGQEEDG